MIPLDTSHIVQYLASGSIVMIMVQSFKNLAPTIFANKPKLAITVVALLSLLISIGGCLMGGKGIDVGCVTNAVLTFLTAIGVYHSVAQSGGSVQPPLPPAPGGTPGPVK